MVFKSRFSVATETCHDSSLSSTSQSPQILSALPSGPLPQVRGPPHRSDAGRMPLASLGCSFISAERRASQGSPSGASCH